MNAKRNSEEAIKRRVRAGRLLLAGKSPPEVARLVGAPRQTVYRWREVLDASGIDALRNMSTGGRPPELGAAELSRLYVMLLEGATAHGFATPLWTLKRVRLLIEREFGVRYSEVHVWRLLGQLGLSNQKPDRRALERDEAAIEHWRKRTWPALKKRRSPRQTDRLHRRVRGLRATHAGAHLGREGRDPNGAVPLQLASTVADCRHALHRLVLSPA
jgi:transposase